MKLAKSTGCSVLHDGTGRRRRPGLADSPSLPPTPAEAVAHRGSAGREDAGRVDDAGILHRDLKPSNILMRCGERRTPPELIAANTGGGRSAFPTPLPGTRAEDRRLRVGQTLRGSVGHDRTMTQAGDILGTPSYMAPEQAKAWYRGSRASGRCLCCRGHSLRDARRSPALSKRRRGPAPSSRSSTTTDAAGRLAPHVPRDLETICLKCLQKDQRKRYATAAQMADDLERFLVGRRIVARPVSPIERLWKWARRHPSVAALLGTTVAAVIAALVGTTTMWMRRTTGRRAKSCPRSGRATWPGGLEEQKHETDYRLARGYLERGQAACQSHDRQRGLILMAKAVEMTENLRPVVGDGRPATASINSNGSFAPTSQPGNVDCKSASVPPSIIPSPATAIGCSTSTSPDGQKGRARRSGWCLASL